MTPADLRAEWNRLPEMEEDDLRDGLLDRLADLDNMVLSTPVQTMAGAVCVLRRLLDPIKGVGVTDGRSDGPHAVAVRHVLAVFEPWAAVPPTMRMEFGGGVTFVPPADRADAALIEAGREMTEVCALIKVEEDAGLDNPGGALFDHFNELETTILTTPAETLAGAVVKLRRLADPAQGIGPVENPGFLPALMQAISVIEGATLAPSAPAGDEALILAERELHEAATALEKWCAENPGVDHDRTEEWARISTIYWDRILGADPAGVDGAAVMLRALIDQDMGLKGGIPHNIADIVTRVSRAVDRGAAIPATMRVEYAGDDALVKAEQEMHEVGKTLLAEAKGKDHDFDQNPSYARHEALENLIAETPAKTIHGALAKLRWVLDSDFGLPRMVSDGVMRDSHLPALQQILETLEGVAGQTKPQAAEPSEDDTALIAAEREFYASVATTEQWTADNPDKSLEDNPEWARCQELYDDVLALVPAGAVGVAAILRVLLYREWCNPDGSPGNMGDILAHVLRVIERGARIPPQPDPVLALLGELEQANDAARRNSEAWDAAVTEGFPDHADIGPGKRWATVDDLPEDLRERLNAATHSDRVLAIDKEDAAIVDRQNDIEDRIIATRGCSPAGALVKLRAAVGLWQRRAGEPELPAWHKLDRNEKLIVSAMRDLERVTGERPAS